MNNLWCLLLLIVTNYFWQQSNSGLVMCRCKSDSWARRSPSLALWLRPLTLPPSSLSAAVEAAKKRRKEGKGRSKVPKGSREERGEREREREDRVYIPTQWSGRKARLVITVPDLVMQKFFRHQQHFRCWWCWVLGSISSAQIKWYVIRRIIVTKHYNKKHVTKVSRFNREIYLVCCWKSGLR